MLRAMRGSHPPHRVSGTSDIERHLSLQHLSLQLKLNHKRQQLEPSAGGKFVRTRVRRGRRNMTRHLLDALVTKLTATNVLNGDDIRAILALPVRSRRLGPHEAVAQDGTKPSECCLLGEGFAYRSKNTPDGQRQILSIHIPGEIPDLQSLHLKVMDHDLVTLSSCTLGFIAHSALRQLNIERSQVAAALWRETLVDAAIFREWIVN